MLRSVLGACRQCVSCQCSIAMSKCEHLMCQMPHSCRDEQGCMCACLNVPYESETLLNSSTLGSIAAKHVRHACMQVKYPENFFLLRGNHECASINRIYGFYDECKRRYNIRLWKTFTDCFNCLPVAALVDEKVRILNHSILFKSLSTASTYQTIAAFHLSQPCCSLIGCHQQRHDH